MTYAKLMASDQAFIDGIEPDFIVLDEFHRCAAAEWGKGVDRLLVAFPDVPALGLTAAHIRYLDNGGRDMSEEFINTLDATWGVYFELAEKFYRENVYLDIPTTYRSGKLNLGKWVSRFRYSERKKAPRAASTQKNAGS